MQGRLSYILIYLYIRSYLWETVQGLGNIGKEREQREPIGPEMIGQKFVLRGLKTHGLILMQTCSQPKQIFSQSRVTYI